LKIEPISQVVISNDYKGVIEALKESSPKESRFELFIKDDSNFLVSDANEVIAKAYLSSLEKVFICLGANKFSDIVQNRLLKIIEEPPRNKEFILITPLKSALLPTIKSRLPITTVDEVKESIDIELDVSNLNLQSVYDFVQKHKFLKPNDAIAIVEKIIQDALKSDKFKIDQNTLDLFGKSREALNLGSPADFTLTTILLKLLAKKVK